MAYLVRVLLTFGEADALPRDTAAADVGSGEDVSEESSSMESAEGGATAPAAAVSCASPSRGRGGKRKGIPREPIAFFERTKTQHQKST